MEALLITVIALAFFFTLAIVALAFGDRQGRAAQAGTELLGQALVSLINVLRDLFP